MGAPQSFLFSSPFFVHEVGHKAMMKFMENLRGSRVVTGLWSSGLCRFSPGRAEEGCERQVGRQLFAPLPTPSASSPFAAFGALSFLSRLRGSSVLPAARVWLL